jgi:hypothetical protein
MIVNRDVSFGSIIFNWRRWISGARGPIADAGSNPHRHPGAPHGECPNIDVEGKFPDTKHFAKASAHGHRPPIPFSLCLPIGRDNGRRGEIPAVRQIVIDKILPQKLAHIFAMVIPRIRPKVVCQQPHHPGALPEEPHSCRAGGPFPGTQNFIRPGGKLQNCTHSSNQSATFGR